jgi:hypothetical protein
LQWAARTARCQHVKKHQAQRHKNQKRAAGAGRVAHRVCMYWFDGKGKRE